MTDTRRTNRRAFLKNAAGVGIGAGIFHVVPASALGLGGRGRAEQPHYNGLYRRGQSGQQQHERVP